MKWRMKPAALAPSSMPLTRKRGLTARLQQRLTTDVSPAIGVLPGEAEAVLHALGAELRNLFN